MHFGRNQPSARLFNVPKCGLSFQHPYGVLEPKGNDPSTREGIADTDVVCVTPTSTTCSRERTPKPTALEAVVSVAAQCQTLLQARQAVLPRNDAIWALLSPYG